MSITRRNFLAGVAGLIAAPEILSSGRAAAPSVSGGGPVIVLPAVSLRGYGTLSAVFRHVGDASLTHVTCESAAKALLTQAKYLSDLERIPGMKEVTLKLHGQAIPSRKAALGGVIACCADGQDVLIVAAPSEERAAALLGTALTQAVRPADFLARAKVPMYLDRWDKYGLLIYYAPYDLPGGYTGDPQAYDYGQDFEFMRDNNIGPVLWTNALGVDSAEGLTTEINWAWIQENARRMNIPVHINTSYSYPVLWLSNRYRDQTQLKAPQFLGGYYGVAHDSLGQGAISWAAEEAYDAYMGIYQHTVKRFAPDANVVGWLEPHGETAEDPQSALLEYGPVADKSYRRFLEQRWGSPAAVSKRWHGAAGHVKDWSDVRLPEVAEFCGFGPSAIDMRGAWRIKYAPAAPATVPPEWYTPGFDDSGWDEFVAPGNDRMRQIPRAPLVYRRSIDIPAGWQQGKPALLYVWNILGDAPQAYVNGQQIPPQRRNSFFSNWSFFDVSAALKPGANQVTLYVPSALICYRVYLTTEPHGDYPHFGKLKNARWADFANWIVWSRGQQVRRGAEMIRQIDPDRSINFMSPDPEGPIAEVCREYGGRFHDTGAMAGFWTDEPSLMMAGKGLPVTAEAGGGAEDARVFQLYWGRWLTEGLNGIHYFQTLYEIKDRPDVLKVFEANRAMYEMVGKYHVPFTKLGILFSSRVGHLTGFPWDPGVSGFQETGYYRVGFPAALVGMCPRGGVTEEDFHTPVVDDYKMIVDCNTPFVTGRLMDGIERWVRAGGVFMTYEQTGRHTETEPDSWPISRLSGYQQLDYNVYQRGLTASAAKGQTVLTGDAWTTPWRTTGNALKKLSPDCIDLLVYNDGTTALGMRPLGKGWIIHTGLQNDGGPIANLIATLARHFGAAEPVPVGASPWPGGFHLRHYVSNTGLHDIFVLFNEGGSPIKTELVFQPGFHPSEVTDLITQESLPITRQPAGDTIPGVTLDPFQSRMFISPRADIAASPMEWLALQRGWWQGTQKPPARPLPTTKELQQHVLDLSDDWAWKRIDNITDEQALALAQPGYDDEGWERRNLDAWLFPGDMKPKRIIMRKKVTIPAHWNNGRIFLTTNYAHGEYQDNARTIVQGQVFANRYLQNGPMTQEYPDVFKPGATFVLAADIRANNSLIGWRDPIWLHYIPEPPARQSLAGTWTVHSDAIHVAGTLQLPGATTGAAFLSRTVVIDKAHRNSNVVVFVEQYDTGVGAVLINGRQIDVAGTPGKEIVVVNVAPMVVFGGENTIEIRCGSNPSPTAIKTVELRFYKKGVFP